MVGILGAGSLETVLEAGLDNDDLSQVPDHIELEYVQGRIKGVERVFSIFDDIYLNYCLENCNPKGFESKRFRDQSVAVCTTNLTYISEQPERRRYIAWRWLFSALVFMVLAFAIIYESKYSHWGFEHEAMLPAGIALVVFAVIALIISYTKIQYKVIYKSDVGQVPIFELFSFPKEKAYKIFVSVLNQSIYKAHHRGGVTMKYRLVGELKYLRKLSEAGIIAQSDYEKAREKILSEKE